MKETARSRVSRNADLWGFLLFSHGWAWTFWSVLAFTGWGPFEYPGVVFLFVGGTGPMLGGVVMSGFVGGRDELHDLARRAVDPRLVPARWWLFVLSFFPIVTALAAVFVAVFDPSAQPVDIGGALEAIADPAAFAPTLVFLFLLGPLPEEIGWRGFFLDRLQLRWGALTASLVVGAAWMAWHAPLFLMSGYYDAFGGPPSLLPFAVGTVVVSVFYTLVHNNAERSLLAAVFFHYLQNLTGELLSPAPVTETVGAVLFVVLAAGVVVVWGPRNLRLDSEHPRPETGLRRNRGD